MWLRWWEVLLNPLGNDSVVTEDWQLLKFSLWWNLGSIKAWSKKWQKWEKEKKKNIKISIGQSHHSYLEFYMRSHQNWVQGVMLESCHFKDQVISEIRYSASFFFFSCIIDRSEYTPYQIEFGKIIPRNGPLFGITHNWEIFIVMGLKYCSLITAGVCWGEIKA